MKSANCLLRQKHPTVPVGAHLGATHPPVPVGAAMAAVETPPAPVGNLHQNPKNLPDNRP